MTWQLWGDTAQRCGDYSICKCKVGGKWICQLWLVSNNPRDKQSEKLGQGTYQEMLDLFSRETEKK